MQEARWGSVHDQWPRLLRASDDQQCRQRRFSTIGPN